MIIQKTNFEPNPIFTEYYILELEGNVALTFDFGGPILEHIGDMIEVPHWEYIVEQR